MTKTLHPRPVLLASATVLGLLSASLSAWTEADREARIRDQEGGSGQPISVRRVYAAAPAESG